MQRGTPPPRPKRISRNSSRSSNSSEGSQEKIGLGARIAQNIDMAKKGYEQLVHAIIRPPRAKYSMDQLGPSEFTFLGQRFQRDDVEILSSNIATNDPMDGERNVDGGGTPTCSFLKMQASIWTRVSNAPHSPTRPVEAQVQDKSNGDNGDNTTPPPPPRTKNTMVVYLHGNASARVEVVPNLSFLLAQVGVFGVVGLDFTGSGKSDGDWVSLGYYERVDLECLIQYLKRVYGGPDGTDLEIILWGRSMGASAALMHAGKKSFTAKNTPRNSSTGNSEEFVAADSATVGSNRSRGGINGSITVPPSNESGNLSVPNTDGNLSILKGLICDSPFSSLYHLCEELVERARDQGVVVPGVIVSVAIAMIARSVRRLANFNIREITPIEDVPNIDVPALFVVGADDDFITPQHSERLVEAYKGGVTTNLFMVPGGHNDARPQIVFQGIEEFCKQRLSLTEESALPIPAALLPSIHQNPPWAYSRSSHFQVDKRSRSIKRDGFSGADANAANIAAESLGMTQDLQDDIQNKIGLMMGGQGKEMRLSSDEDSV